MTVIRAAVIALALAGCSSPTSDDRQAFDEFLARANGGPLGVAVAPGTEDRIFECYTAKAAEKRIPIKDLTKAIRDFLKVESVDQIPPDKRQDFIVGVLAVSSTVVTCQGGLPENMR